MLDVVRRRGEKKRAVPSSLASDRTNAESGISNEKREAEEAEEPTALTLRGSKPGLGLGLGLRDKSLVETAAVTSGERVVVGVVELLPRSRSRGDEANTAA